MTSLGEHSSDTNKGVIRSKYTSNCVLEMNGDFGTFHHMREIIDKFEQAAYRAGLKDAKAVMCDSVDERFIKS